MQRTPLAIVTGAGGNLGSAVVARLTASGYRVARVHRNVMHLAEEYDCEIDLGDRGSVTRAFAEAARRAGKLDALIHTVGTFHSGAGVAEAADSDYQALFQTNVMTTLHVLQAALPLLHGQREGSVAVVCARDALSGSAGHAAYAASKAAQLRIVESAAAEAKPFGVRINALLPGTMDTPQNRAAMPEADRSSWLQVPAVAEVLCYLVSPAAAAVQGQAITL
ncbi:MAG TPA: SDR family NAD(P)-dependent oxidoreductase [Polyangiales bacterium]|jgi:NAD(P)-dependent dehydrogenase (short-subunit alcohol dehydrogenase family)|nr:SDR family NAD(P)-dependent oxidoreductase [Polyangiales bacterium]